jgi:hypothetical protein
MERLAEAILANRINGVVNDCSPQPVFHHLESPRVGDGDGCVFQESL